MIYIGIDVAKHHHDVLGLDEAGQVVLPAFRIGNTRPEAVTLLAQLQGFTDSVQVAMESTGHYWLPLYEFLVEHQVRVTVFNPLQIQAYRRVGVRKTKTDRLDSFLIADFLRTRPAHQVLVSPPAYRSLRHLTRFRFRLIDRLSSLRRRAHRLLDQVFPEYPALFARPFIGTSRVLLHQAVTADDFLAWPLADLAETIRLASRGRLRADKAQAIHQAARQSLGVSSLNQVAALEMGWLLEQMALLDEQVAALDASLLEQLATIPQHLTSIPGISTTLAASILGEIGDIHRFPQLKALVAFAGLDPSVHQSGQFQAAHSHLSKRGSPYLRRAIWLATMTARRFDPQLAAYYQRKRKQGKHHNLVMAALCHRLLARVYVVLREDRPYEIRQ